MQGLRPQNIFSPVVDENAGAVTTFGGPKKGLGARDENAGVGLRAGKSAGLSTRKALGNITNQGTHTSDSHIVQKKGLGLRRALGDITNATPAKGVNNPSGAPETSVGETIPMKSLSSRHKAAKFANKSEILAQNGVERVAGKTWSQQLRDEDKRCEFSPL